MKEVYVNSLIDSHGGSLRIMRYLKAHPDCGFVLWGTQSSVLRHTLMLIQELGGKCCFTSKAEELMGGVGEFVEFLEKELNITDAEVEAKKDKDEGNAFRKYETEKNGSGSKTEAAKQSSIEYDSDEIEATLAQLKRELGL